VVERPRVAARRAELGGATDPELHNWLVTRLAEHLGRHGRRAMVWDEVLEGPDVPGVVVASWRGEHGVRVGTRRGYDVVSSPADRVYLDYRQSDDPDEPIPTGAVTTLLDIYGFDPAAASGAASGAVDGAAVPDSGTTGVLLGAQANLWTEHIDSRQVLEYMAFPRVAALAEALWSAGERDGKEFLERLAVHLGRLDARGVAYRNLGGPEPWQKRPGVPGDARAPHELEAQIAQMVAAFDKKA
jgi:hexosaminidase